MERLMVLLLPIVFGTQDSHQIHRGRAFVNGPVAHDFQYDRRISAHEVMTRMVDSMEQKLLGAAYGRARTATLSASMDFDVPGSSLSSKMSNQQVSFSLQLEGLITPNGRYRYEVGGDFGTLELARNHKRSLTVSHDFRAFSDRASMGRNPLANLSSFRSYALKKWTEFKAPLFDTGVYRVAYGGSANFEGRLIHVIRVFKPPKKVGRKPGPIPIQKLWTFWRDGAYEIWVYQDNFLPAAVFFTGIDDNIFANLRFTYDRDHMPVRLTVENNSPGFEGHGTLVFQFDAENLLKGISLDFSSDAGHDIRVDANISFSQNENDEGLVLIPPFGYQKVNQDHLKLLVTTHLAGGLLNLKKHGVNIRNFKF